MSKKQSNKMLGKRILSFMLAFLLMFGGMMVPGIGMNTANAEVGQDPVAVAAPPEVVDRNPQITPVVAYSTWDPTPRWDGSGTTITKPYDTVQLWYQQAANGNEMFCIEPDVGLAADAQLVRRGIYDGYKADEIKLAIILLNRWDVFNDVKHGNFIHNNPGLLQAVIWSILGRAEVEGYMKATVDNVKERIAQYKAGTYANPEHFAGDVTLYRYSQGPTYQQMVSYSFEPTTPEGDLTLVKTGTGKSLTDQYPAGYSLAGAQYGVYKTETDAAAETNAVGTFTTLADGTSNTIKGLASGTYYVKELVAPKGYKLDKTIKTVAVTAGTTKVNVSDAPKFDPSLLLLRKTDKDGKPLAGAEFEVKAYDGQLTLAQTQAATPKATWYFKTDANGVIVYDAAHQVTGKGNSLYTSTAEGSILPIGTYTFKEVSAPSGYVLDSTVRLSRITEGGATSVGLVYNAPIVSNIQQNVKVPAIVKITGANKAKVGGAEFAIYDASGNSVGTAISNATTGEANLGELPVGEYTIKEIKSPDGYVNSSDVVKLSLKADPTGATISTEFSAVETANVKVVNGKLEWNNEAQKGVIKVKKFDSVTKTGLKDAEFVIKNSAGTVVDTITTVDGGLATSKQLPLGTYTMEESKAPANYSKSAEKVTIVIAKDDTGEALTKNITMSGSTVVTLDTALVLQWPNKPQEGIIRIEKFDEATKKMLTGAEFEISNADGVVATLSVNAEGIAISKALPLGTYTVKETKAPDGYALSKETVSVVIAGDSTGNALTNNITMSGSTVVTLSDAKALQWPNKPQLMRFTIQKQDIVSGKTPSGDATLANAVFNVVDANTKEVVKTVTAGTDGRIIVNGLPLGTYDVIETTAPKGYELNEVGVRVQGTSDGLGGVYTTKVSQVSLNADILATMFNDKIDALNALNEMNANGAEFRTFEHITAPTLTTVEKDNPDVDYYDLATQGRISITKHKESMDENEATLSGEREKEAGITFEIMDKDGKIVDSIITDADGRASSKWLPYGTYTVHQATKAPKYLNVDDFEVTISKPWAEYQFNLENYPNSKTLQIVKLDEETGKEIPQSGITFQLLNAKKEVVEMQVTYPTPKTITEFVTGDDGKVTLPEKIMPGTYFIKEVKAPTGYYLDPNGEPLEITLADDNNKLIIESVKNTPQKGQLTLHKKGELLVGTNVAEIEKQNVTELLFSDGYLAGTEWTLKAAEDIYSGDKQTKIYSAGDVVDVIVTQEEVPVKSKEVPLGKYTLEETKAPKQYVRDAKVYNIEFTPQVQDIRIDSQSENKYNERKTLDFEFTKEFEGSKTFTKDMTALFGIFNSEEISENGVTVVKDTLLGVERVTVEEEVIYEDVEKEIEKVVDKEVQVKEPIIEFELREIGEKEVEDKTKPIYGEVEKFVVTETESGEVTEFATVEEKDAHIATLTEQAIEFTEEVIKEATEEIVGYEMKTIQEVVNRYTFDNKEEFEAKKAELVAAGTKFEEEDKSIAGSTELQKETIKETIIEKVPVKTVFKVSGKFEDIKVDGKFYIQELEAAKGYVLDDTKYEEGFDFATNNEKANTVTKVEPIVNKLERTEIEVIKYEMGSDESIPVANAKYRLVAVDETLGKTVIGEYLTDENGIIVIDNLETGKYYLEEVEAPEGYFESEDITNIDLSDAEKKYIVVENEKIPEVATQARELENGKQEVNPLENVVFKDTVAYKDLIVGKEYEVKGTLMDKETGEPIRRIDGSIVTAVKKFIPETRDGEVEILFNLDTSILRGKEVVVFEDLYRDGKLLNSHADINDDNQTVKVTNPEIGTTFANFEDEKIVLPLGKMVFVDNVEYKDLVVGEEYVMNLTLMFRDTGKVVLDLDGNPYTSTYKFTPTEADGVVQVKVEIDVSLLRGKKIVAFEQLFNRGQIIAVHEDLEDEGQTVEITNPEIGTKFADINGGKEVHAIKEVEFIDHVDYKDLVVGKEYELNLRIAIKGTDEFLKDAEGNDIVISKKFVAEETTGVVPVEATLDLTGLEGKEIVAFEKLFHEGIEIAAHEDIEDEGQTVRVTEPEIGTKFFDIDKHQETHAVKITLTDNVEYKDLIVGKEYVAELVVMNKETGEPLEIDGKVVTAKKEFVAETKDGIVEVEVEVNLSDLEGKEIVAFEKVFYEGQEIAAHEDLEDEGQTIKIEEPEIGTKFVEFEGTDEVHAIKNVTLVDNVEFKNLVIGKKYVAELVVMNKETGEPLEINGEIVTAKKEFVAETKDGMIEVEVEVDLSGLEGKEIVAFEKVLYNDQVIAAHEDLEDEDQTIKITKPEIGTKFADIDGEKEVHALEEVTLVDHVEFKDLIIGKEYVAELVVMNKETGEPLEVNGEIVTAKKEFVAETKDGMVEVEIVVDLSEIAGKEIVAFEKVLHDNQVIATHEDLEDEGQTVRVTEPEIGTKFMDIKENKEVHAVKNTKLIDYVEFKDLIVGKNYVAELIVMDKETGEPLLINGEIVTAKKEFVAETKDGMIEVEIEVDLSGLEGKEIVAFERVSHNGKTVATHEDLEDEGQTIKVKKPNMGTKAVWGKNDKKVVEGEIHTLTDTVKYENLIIGQEYKLVGWVVFKDNGEAVTQKVEKTFVAESENGEVTMEFQIDTNNLGGRSLVVFEELFDMEGNLIVEHKDINDKEQTVEIEKKKEIIVTEKEIKPKTEDNTVNPLIYAGLAGTTAALGFAILFATKKKKEDEEKAA